VVCDFFTCRLRFPCDPILPAILDTFSVKIHQLSPNSFLEVSKFIWIMKTFGCNFRADVFARFFELVIVPDVIKVDDDQFYEAHYTCCTFNTRRQNTRRRITRIQITPCCKTNSRKTGAHIGSTSKLTCPRFLTTKDRPILSPRLWRR
jgi:hypothetical protein